jgi:hypothetical protein
MRIASPAPDGYTVRPAPLSCTGNSLAKNISCVVRAGAALFAAAAAISIVLLSPLPGWAWGGDGHQITALIAADHLSSTARSHVAQILGVPDDQRSVANAMARAALVPDSKYRASAPETLDWHFINICRQDTPAQVDERCPDGNCVTARIDRFAHDLRAGKPDGKWDAAAQLEFVINLMGEVHQPFHATTNADLGGKCLGVISPEPANSLHSLWGERMVAIVEHQLHTSGPAETAAALQRRFPAGHVTLHSPRTIAWDSHMLAEHEAYTPLQIPLQPCKPTTCIKQPAVRINRAYLNREWPVAAKRLATGGYQLAALLNSIWKQ